MGTWRNPVNPHPVQSHTSGRRKKGATVGLREKLGRLLQLALTMPPPDSHLATTTPTHRYGPANPNLGLPFQLSERLDFTDTPYGDPRGIRTRTGVDTWARTWIHAWIVVSDNELSYTTGSPLIWLYTHLDWAQRSFPALDEFETDIDIVTRRLEHAHGLDAIHTDTPCPTCTRPLTHPVSDHGVSDNFECVTCQATYTPQGLTYLALQHAANDGIRVTRTQACALFNLPHERLRQWIARGKLTEHDGLINLTDLLTLTHT